MKIRAMIVSPKRFAARNRLVAISEQPTSPVIYTFSHSLEAHAPSPITTPITVGLVLAKILQLDH
jgi:hypothetical protein